MTKKVLSLVFLSLCFFLNAQEMAAVHEPEMADQIREDGKIWIVVTVIAMIFVALAAFMMRLEKKIKKLEEKIK